MLPSRPMQWPISCQSENSVVIFSGSHVQGVCLPGIAEAVRRLECTRIRKIPHQGHPSRTTACLRYDGPSHQSQATIGSSLSPSQCSGCHEGTAAGGHCIRPDGVDLKLQGLQIAASSAGFCVCFGNRDVLLQSFLHLFCRNCTIVMRLHFASRHSRPKL